MSTRRILEGIAAIGLYIAAPTLRATAQMPVTTTGGTSGSIPKFSGSAILTNSTVVEVNGKVGIGTGAPDATLDISGGFLDIHTNPDQYSLSQTDSSSSPIVNNGIGSLFAGDLMVRSFWGVSVDLNNGNYGDNAGPASQTRIPGTSSFTINSRHSPTSFQTLFAVRNNGNVGIGTISPNYLLTLGHDTSYNQNLTGSDNVLSTIAFQNNTGTIFTNAAVSAVQPNGEFADAAALAFSTSYGGLTERMRILPKGQVGIGTKNPTATLEVAGTVKLSGGGSSITFPDGSVQQVAWTGSLCGGDYAESVNVSGGRANYEPGDVLVIDFNHPGKFLKSNEPYSSRLAGIYSTKPGVVGRRQITGVTESTDEIPMAMIGIVPTKVTAENGPIKPGDFIVTSSVPGYAMKGTDRSLMFGAVMGKALGSLDSGKGVIEVLVALQ